MSRRWLRVRAEFRVSGRECPFRPFAVPAAFGGRGRAEYGTLGREGLSGRCGAGASGGPGRTESGASERERPSRREALPDRAAESRYRRVRSRCALRPGWGSCWRADWTIMTIRERSQRYIQYDLAPPHLADEPTARRCPADPVHPARTVLRGPTCHTLPRGKERHRNPSCGHVNRSTIFA
jgi:hypothetical protein